MHFFILPIDVVERTQAHSMISILPFLHHRENAGIFKNSTKNTKDTSQVV